MADLSTFTIGMVEVGGPAQSLAISIGPGGSTGPLVRGWLLRRQRARSLSRSGWCV